MESHRSRNHYHFIVCFIVALLLIGCGQREDRTSLHEQELPLKATITLHEIAAIDSFGDHYFSNLRKPMLTQNGDLILSDFNAQMLFRINGEGELLQTIGRDGRGPGEFQSIHSMVMAPGDTLHVFDYNNMRQQLFATDDSEWSASREVIRRRPSVETEGLNYFEPSLVFEVDNELMGLFRNHIVPGDSATMYHSWLSHLDHNLSPKDDEKILLKPSEDALVISIPGGMLVNSHPFSYQLYRAWNPAEQLLAEISNADAVLRHFNTAGDEVRVVQLPYELAEPDETARDGYEKLMSENYGNDIAREARQKSLTHEPVVKGFFSDDEGRYWLQMHRLDPETPNWMVFGSDGELLGSFLLAGNNEAGNLTRPLVVNNGRIYAMHYDNFEPSLRIYEAEFGSTTPGDYTSE